MQSHAGLENIDHCLSSFSLFLFFIVKGSKDVPKQTPMTHEDFELCRRVALEEEKRGRLSSTGSNNIDVPPLSIESHMEMMHGASAGICIYIIHVF